jgi:hypothetical protein
MARYHVKRIADASCDSLTGQAYAETDDLAEALGVAEHGSEPYGRGILDTMTGRIDVGFGFGIACPDQWEV